MLEYCPHGNLRSYLIEHEKLFKDDLRLLAGLTEHVENNKREGIAHDTSLLCSWACQVT